MLDANLKTQLKTYLGRLILPIEITASLDESDKSREMQALLAEIAELSPLITLREVRDDAERKPSFAI
ncbi:MAG TPA: alkyl hydroperoxide reductase subunit F, partial [Burkholderiaceae bacterium]|nr:alkyl hydroperoxide reductase subunit F [Burkholderiaceae bacterium]